MLLAIEEHIGRKLETLDLPEDEVLTALGEVGTARRTAILELTENGFLEREKERRDKRKAARLGLGEGEGDGEGEGEGEGEGRNKRRAAPRSDVDARGPSAAAAPDGTAAGASSDESDGSDEVGEARVPTSAGAGQSAALREGKKRRAKEGGRRSGGDVRIGSDGDGLAARQVTPAATASGQGEGHAPRARSKKSRRAATKSVLVH